MELYLSLVRLLANNLSSSAPSLPKFLKDLAILQQSHMLWFLNEHFSKRETEVQ